LNFVRIIPAGGAYCEARAASKARDVDRLEFIENMFFDGGAVLAFT
jgi:hypothetical protein